MDSSNIISILGFNWLSMISKYYNAEVFEYWGSRNPFLKLMAAVKQSAQTAKQKGQIYGRDVPHKIDIDEHYLEWLFIEQMGCCPYYEKLGIIKPLNLNLLYETYNFLTPSVDRINSNFGYIKGNVVITFRGINNAKLNIPYDRFMNQLAEFEGINIKVIKKSKNIINKLFNPNLSNNMKYLNLLKVFVEAGELEYANKVLEQSEGNVSSTSTKRKPKRKTKVSSSELKRMKLKKLIHNVAKPFNPTIPTLKVAGDVFGLAKSSYLYSRKAASIEMLADSGSVYLNRKAQSDGWLVDTSIVDEDFILSMDAA